MPGEESLILRRRLAKGFDLTLQAFRYSAASSSMGEITEHLDSFVRELKAPAVHFLGHSLGGLVIYRFLERFPNQPPGRVVFLGTPCVGSRAAERAARFSPVSHLMGPSVAAGLLRPQERGWGHARPLGVYAHRQQHVVRVLFA